MTICLTVRLCLRDEGEYVLNLVPRIDDHGLARGLVANDGTVALQRADGKDFVDHCLVVSHQLSVISH